MKVLSASEKEKGLAFVAKRGQCGIIKRDAPKSGVLRLKKYQVVGDQQDVYRAAGACGRQPPRYSITGSAWAIAFQPAMAETALKAIVQMGKRRCSGRAGASTATPAGDAGAELISSLEAADEYAETAVETTDPDSKENWQSTLLMMCRLRHGCAGCGVCLIRRASTGLNR